MASLIGQQESHFTLKPTHQTFWRHKLRSYCGSSIRAIEDRLLNGSLRLIL